MNRKTIELLDVKTDILTFQDASQIFENFVESGKTNYVCVNSAQDIMIAQKNERFKMIVNNANLVIPDGMPLVWLSKLIGYKKAERVTGPDIMLAMCSRSPKTGHTHFFYGGKKGVPELIKKKLTEKFPGLQVVGVYSPPFRPLTKEEDDRDVEMINAAKPDFLWVGLGTPKQHYWIADHVNKLKVSVVVGVGAAFDYHSGEMKRAPRWMQNRGMEWLFRLTYYPAPVWRRYAEYLPKFAFRVTLGLLGFSRYKPRLSD